MEFVLGKPDAKTVHLVSARSHLKNETECGLKRWKQATVAIEWVSCEKCIQRHRLMEKLREVGR